MVPVNTDISLQQAIKLEVLRGHGKHIIFVLDMSGSMKNAWSGVVVAYNRFIARRRQEQCESDFVSVVQFDSQAHVSVSMQPIGEVPNNLIRSDGGTCFAPAALQTSQVASKTPLTHVPTVVFMSDGIANDTTKAVNTFAQLNDNIYKLYHCDLELHVIAFSERASIPHLQQIADSSRNGKLHKSADTAELSSIFIEIARSENVSELLEVEISKRIAEVVLNKLSIEYIA